jgi:tRNA threonylcarbamoyladenosine biosynthesis protein TsaB
MVKRILALETSSARLSLAVGEGAQCLARYAGANEWRHAETLFAALDQVMRKSRTTFEQFSEIAVSIGPGSFTGIRIGLAAARTLGQFLKIPLVGISSLETLAFGAHREAGVIGVSMDALRGDVFGAIYERAANERWCCRLSDKKMTRPEWERECKKWSRREIPFRSVELDAARGIVPDAKTLLDLSRLRKPKSYSAVVPSYLRDAAPVERRRR